MSEPLLATLAAVAALFDGQPDLPLPLISIYPRTPHKADLAWYLNINDRGDEEMQREIAALIVRTIGGEWTKSYTDNEARMVQQRGGLNMTLTVTRAAVCERVVTGVKSVTIPAKPAEPERTVEVEQVEWKCGPVLGGVA